MRISGIEVTTVDIAADIEPDVVASVTELPFADASFDATVACEVLEHIRFEDVPKALSEIARVSRSSAIISLPHPGRTFISAPVLLLGGTRIDVRLQIPFFWRKHTFDGQHYWELGKRGTSVARFLQLAQEAGLTLRQQRKYADDPVHRFFLFEKVV
jgi:SAM-dependent methyltransferase